MVDMMPNVSMLPSHTSILTLAFSSKRCCASQSCKCGCKLLRCCQTVSKANLSKFMCSPCLFAPNSQCTNCTDVSYKLATADGQTVYKGVSLFVFFSSIKKTFNMCRLIPTSLMARWANLCAITTFH